MAEVREWMTPGPWKAERIGEPRSKHEDGMMFRILAPESDDRRRRDIALLWHKPYAEEATANANGIAAVPDMIETLKQIQALADENRRSRQDGYAEIEELARRALDWVLRSQK